MIPEIIASATESLNKGFYITGFIVIAVLIGLAALALFSKNDQFGRDSQFEKSWTISYGNTTVASAKLRPGHADSYGGIIRFAKEHDLAFADESLLNAILEAGLLFRNWRYVAFIGDTALMIDGTVNRPKIQHLHSKDIGIYDERLRLLVVDMRTAPSKQDRSTPVEPLPA